MNEQVLEDRVRVGLQDLAGHPVGRDYAWGAMQRARADAERRRPRITVWLAAAAVVLVALGGAGAAHLLMPSGVPVAASMKTSIIDWPARGDLASNSALIDKATRIWRSTAPADRRPEQEVAVLYAGVQPEHAVGAGATVVMLMSRSGGRTLVGMVSSVQNLTGPPRSSTTLLLRSVVAVDQSTAIRSVGFVAPGKPADHPGSMGGALGYVLLAPGIGAGQVQSSMYDSIMTDTDTLPAAPTGLLGFEGLPGAGPWNSWVVTPKSVAGVDVLGGAVDAPDYTAGRVDSAGAVSTVDGGALHVGDVVVARDERSGRAGLLGVVTQSDGAAGTLDASLNGLGRWNLQAISYGSNYHGTLSRNASGSIVFTPDQPQTPKGVSRVVAHTTDGSVTVNVGYFAPAAPGTPNTKSPFPLAQCDTLPHAGSLPVWIIATGA